MRTAYVVTEITRTKEGLATCIALKGLDGLVAPFMNLSLKYKY